MAAESHGFDLVPAVALLGAGVIAVPIFKRLGLGSVLGYLVAGLAIGPFGIGLFTDPGSILSVAELGVVMLLFIIGLEMKPSRLWALRREIFGLGLAQVAGLRRPSHRCRACSIGAAPRDCACRRDRPCPLLDGNRHADPRGARAVPTSRTARRSSPSCSSRISPSFRPLAIVAFLSPMSEEASGLTRLIKIGIAVGAVLRVYLAGRFLLNPALPYPRRDARAGSDDRRCTAGRPRRGPGHAGRAVCRWRWAPFLPACVLSESTFRHELEADIEPFRGHPARAVLSQRRDVARSFADRDFDWPRFSLPSSPSWP